MAYSVRLFFFTLYHYNIVCFDMVYQKLLSFVRRGVNGSWGGGWGMGTGEEWKEKGSNLNIKPFEMNWKKNIILPRFCNILLKKSIHLSKKMMFIKQPKTVREINCFKEVLFS